MKVYYKYYYTFEDMAKTLNLETFMRTYYQEAYVAPSWYTNANKTYLEELWTRLKHMFYRKGVYFNVLDVDYNTDITSQYLLYLHDPDSEMRIEDLLSTIGETSGKYIELIMKQNTLKKNIVDDITNESHHYFNDTPQTAGSQIDALHTTNYSKDIQKSSLGPVSAKLEEVERAMEDYYERWTYEFRKFILLNKE